MLASMLLLGCFAFSARAWEPKVYRVVSTFYGPGQQGFHWYSDAGKMSLTVDGKVYIAAESTEFQGRYAYRTVVGDLVPGKEYTYKIGDVTGKFKTDPGRGKPMSFNVTGDTQASDAAGFAFSAATVKAAWKQFPKADFTVTLGDLTNDSTNAHWDMYFGAMKDVHRGAAFVPVAGNHDGLLKWDWFRSMFTLKEQPNLSNKTGVYYSFDYGDAHIAVLNSNDMYPMSVQQRNWLVNDMSKTDAKWKLVFLHKSLYSAGNDALSPDVLLLRRALIPLFDKLGVDLVMSGHDHQYYRSKILKGDKEAPIICWDDIDENGKFYGGCDSFIDDGTVYIMPGAACNKRYAIHDLMLPGIRKGAAKHEEPGMPVFANVRIEGNTLTYQAYTYDPATSKSKLYDSMTLERLNAPSPPDPKFKPLPESVLPTLPLQLWNFCNELFRVIVFDYLFTLLPGLLGIRW